MVRYHYNPIKELHEGDYVCLREAPETILKVVNWEQEIIALPRLGNTPPQYMTGNTYVLCKRIFGPPLEADLILGYFKFGPTGDRILFENLAEPNAMLLIAYMASSP